MIRFALILNSIGTTAVLFSLALSVVQQDYDFSCLFSLMLAINAFIFIHLLNSDSTYFMERVDSE